MSFDPTRAGARAAPRRRGPGLHRAHPRPGRSHPARPRRPRPARRRPDRHRQDGRLRAADPPAPQRAAARRRGSCRSATAGPAARPACRSAASSSPRPASSRSRSRRASAPTAAASPIRSTTIYGGVGFEPQVRALRGRPRDRRRDARPAARPRRPAHDRSRLGRDPRPRRGGPDARHGLHPRHPPDPRPAAAAAPEPAVLGDVLRRDPRSSPAGILHDPAQVQIARRNSAVELVRQVVYPVDRERKRELLSHLIRSGRIEQALVFTRTKHGANRLAEQLERDGIAATAIHGNKSQGQRVRALDDFKAGRVADPRRHRDRGPRPRHRRPAARRQLRAADGRRRTTSTGSAGPAAPAWKATPSRSSASTRSALLREIEAVLRQPIPREDDRRASRSTARSGPRPSASGRAGAADQVPRGARTHGQGPAAEASPPHDGPAVTEARASATARPSRTDRRPPMGRPQRVRRDAGSAPQAPGHRPA